MKDAKELLLHIAAYVMGALIAELIFEICGIGGLAIAAIWSVTYLIRSLKSS